MPPFLVCHSVWLWTHEMDNSRVFIGDIGLNWIVLDCVLVGAPGFEPRTSCAQGRRATRLRYAPTNATGIIAQTIRNSQSKIEEQRRRGNGGCVDSFRIH